MTSSPVTVLMSWCMDNDLDAGDLLDHRLHDWTGRFDQVGPHSLKQIPPVFGGKRFDQVLFGCCQDASKANQ